MTFRKIASLRFYVLFVPDPQSEITRHVKEFKFIRRQAHERVMSLEYETRGDAVFLFIIVQGMASGKF